MTQRAMDILTRWIAETVRAVAPEQTDKEAARLAVEFTAYAEDAGLNVEELELDLGQDIPSYMKDALLAVAGTESGGLVADEK